MNKLLGELSFVVHLSRTSGQVLINQNVLHNDPYSIGCVMVTMVISSLDLVYDIGIYCFSVKDAALRSGWSRDNVSEGSTCLPADCCFCGIRIMCQSGSRCLSADCCFCGIRIMCQSGSTCLPADCCFCGIRIMCQSGSRCLPADCCFCGIRIMC